MAEGGYDFENPEFDRDDYDGDIYDIDDKLQWFQMNLLYSL